MSCFPKYWCAPTFTEPSVLCYVELPMECTLLMCVWGCKCTLFQLVYPFFTKYGKINPLSTYTQTDLEMIWMRNWNNAPSQRETRFPVRLPLVETLQQWGYRLALLLFFVNWLLNLLVFLLLLYFLYIVIIILISYCYYL